MIGGQYLDVTGTAPDEATLHRLKTGCLFAASVGLALWAAGVPEAEQGPWRAFGDELGLLFQIVDDILDGDGYVLDARRRRRAAARGRGGRPRPRAARRDRRRHVACCARSSTASQSARPSGTGLYPWAREEAAGRPARRARARRVARAGAGARAGRPRARLREAGPAGRRARRSSTLKSGPPYVSRGGEKLAHALDALGVDPAGLDCLDVGASTGGFTDVLLQRGAARVIALDVGYGQLHPRLRADPRVTVLERTNARALDDAAVRAASSSRATCPSSRCASRFRRRSGSRRRAGRRSCSSSRSSRRAAARSARAASCATRSCARESCARWPRPRSAGGRARSAS